MSIFSLIIFIRNVVYRVLFLIDQILGRKNLITVFCYHSISNDSWRYGVSAKLFKEQMNYMLAKRYTPISTNDLKKFVNGKLKITSPSFVVHFDDGYKDILSVREYLNEKSIKPTVFLLTETKSPNRKELDNNYQFLTDKEIFGLLNDGWEIGSHSKSHSYLANTDQYTLKSEINDSKKALEKRFKQTVAYFAYPRGGYDNKTLTQAYSSGYNLAFSMDDGVISTSADVMRLPRVGVDRTHGFSHFITTFSPSVIAFRSLVKSLGVTI